MSPSELRSLTALLPGGGELKLEPLSAGLKSETYRAVRGGVCYAVKVRRDQAQEPPAERRFAMSVLLSAAHAGLSPRLIAADPTGTMLVLEWLEGTAMSEQVAQRPDATFAALLARVHALPVPQPHRVMSPGAWISHYETLLKLAAIEASEERSARAGIMLKCLELQGPPPKACVCHGDLHRLNVLVRGPGAEPGGLALLDWEYAHVSEPLWDLAGWSANNDYGPDAQAALLAAYHGRPPSVAERERLAWLFWLYDYVCLLWIALYVTRQGAAGSAFRARAGELERRLDSPVCGTIAVPTDF